MSSLDLCPENFAKSRSKEAFAMRNELWQRVSRHRPCPVCCKPDWCLYAGNHQDPEVAICARVESPRRCGGAGWLHRLNGDDRTHSQRQVFHREVPMAAIPASAWGRWRPVASGL